MRTATLSVLSDFLPLRAEEERERGGEQNANKNVYQIRNKQTIKKGTKKINSSNKAALVFTLSQPRLCAD